jgi:SAM-dependent methyltransferase/uncharacterized protein YbaR (Trm112 family)
MRRRHLEALAPRCPVCRSATPLRLARVLREHDEHLVEGWLACDAPNCQREYPILDGIAQFAPDLRAHVEGQLLSFLARDDLHELSESWIGDCAGPQSNFDALRQHVSNYAWDHYAEFDPHAGEPTDRASSILGVLDALWPHVGALPEGPLLEVGCSVGRVAFELAARTQRLVLGADLHQAKLRVAQRVLREQRVRFPLRRVGVVFERREFDVAFEGAERVDFWSLDASRAPFADGSFAAIVALNVLDSTHAPLELLRSCSRLLKPGGVLVLACPYDWSPSAAPLDAWFGGHSQRGPLAGASEAVLRSALGASADESLAKLRLERELDDLEWRVRLHERSVMHYRLHAVIARQS